MRWDGGGVRECAEVIATGGVAVIPTDTLYGLAASISNPDAVARVLVIKGRAVDQGMPVLLASAEQVSLVGTSVSFLAELATAFWPGGLTLVVPALADITPLVTDARGTVGVRVPGMPATRELARLVGGPLTGTSANRAGEPPPVTADEAVAAIGSHVDHVLDGGRVGGRPSSIVDLTTDPPQVLRAGAIHITELRQIVPALVDASPSDAP